MEELSHNATRLRPSSSERFLGISLSPTGMEELGRGATRLRPQRYPPSSSERFLGISLSQSSSPTAPLELSEHDIFNTPSGSSSPSSPHSGLSPNLARIAQSRSHHNGILAALNDNLRARSGSATRPVFNHKAPTSASLSSSASTSPATSTSSRMTIPRRPPPPQALERMRPNYESAPVNVPVVPASLMRRARHLEEMVSEEETDDEMNGTTLPPHEVIATRHSPILACSVLEGVGRTLKGRDLRQVRNAIWRQTGFID